MTGNDNHRGVAETAGQLISSIVREVATGKAPTRKALTRKVPTGKKRKCGWM